jgi:hypothetical protein
VVGEENDRIDTEDIFEFLPIGKFRLFGKEEIKV